MNYSEKRSFLIYLLVTFAVAWSVQILASTIGRAVYQLLLVLCMYAPFLGVLVAKKGLSTAKTGIGWKLSIRKNWKLFLFAWFFPIIITFLGACLYFLCFPDEYDSSFGFLTTAYHAMLDTDGTIQGITMSQLVRISILQAITYAPLINTLAALGEEVGWRGYMTPVLTSWFGEQTAWIISGVIWGLWHAPLIVLIGYEYGIGYFGAPISGVVLFCFITTALGIILSFLYHRSNSIWVPALLHGAFNAAATLPMCFTTGQNTGYLLGPAPNGLLAGIPLMAVAVVIWMYCRHRSQSSF